MQVLLDLLEHGQSYWLDNLTRGMIRSGELGRRVREQGLRGVTSNPAIFHKAISSGSDYDDQIAELASAGASVEAMYESLVVADIREACDVLRPVYDESAGLDGYVSLEVSPHLVHDTAGSLAEARHLWTAVERPNLMIKIPGTIEGVPAIEELLFEGINVNVTLLFAVPAYEEVARAYVRALRRRASKGLPVDRIASVASFFLSRIDVLVDALLSYRVRSPTGDPAAQSLYGRAAIASARLAYRSYQSIVADPEWTSLAEAGARPQRLLWASTSTKNPLYDPVRYVEPLVGRDTVNTMPEETIEAFAESGRVIPDAVEEGLAEAERVFAELAEVGIDMRSVNAQLLAEGAKKFVDPFDKLLAGLAGRRAEMRGDVRAELTEPDPEASGLEAILVALHEQRFALRLAARDPSPWADDPAVQEKIANRLGWTRGTGEAEDQIDAWMAFADEVRGEGIRDVILLGMGGSSLCPLVASRSLAAAEDFPKLRVLDSVDPAAVTRVEEKLDPLTTLFIVASKSGGTIETLTLYRHFRDWLEHEGVPAPGSRFVAVTDPGSPLVGLAEQAGFRRVFEAPPDVGGRYSALTVFGLLPMCLMGGRVRQVLQWAGEMERECSPRLPESANPAVRLGASLGLLAENGRDKLALSATRSVEAFPLWIEQLVAESTGKQGAGIVPVTGGVIPQPYEGAKDRVFLHYSVTGDEDPAGPALEALAREGHPVFHIRIPEPEALGGEFLRWEIATATAGALLGVNPFNEPDVAAAKQATASLLEERAAAGRFSEANVIASEGGVAVLDDGSGDAGPGIERSLADAIRRWLGSESDPPYIAVLGYFEETPGRGKRIEHLRESIERATGTPTTFGYGPRYLHSTGQLHKGGPAGGLYLVLTSDPAEDPPAPEGEPTLGTLLRAQALGDVRTLRERGRSVLHANLGWYVDDGLDTIVDAIETA